MHVEPLRPEFVATTCHHIEDRTFDPTPSATHAHARLRPVHRRPLSPADRLPHCNWTVEIDPAAEPLSEPEGARWLATSNAAVLELVTPEHATDPGGFNDYAREMDPDLRLDAFSQPAL